MWIHRKRKILPKQGRIVHRSGIEKIFIKKAIYKKMYITKKENNAKDFFYKNICEMNIFADIK